MINEKRYLKQNIPKEFSIRELHKYVYKGAQKMDYSQQTKVASSLYEGNIEQSRL